MRKSVCYVRDMRGMFFSSLPVAFFEQKMILDQLVLDLLGHALQWVVFSRMLAGQTRQRLLHFLFHFQVLLECRRKKEKKFLLFLR